MRNICIGIIGTLFILLSNVFQSNAQTGAGRLASVQVDLWPDYDQPAVLVLITAELSSDTELPAIVTINIPASAGEPSAVAVIDENGGMFTADYQTQVGDQVTAVMLQAVEPRVRIEYYYPYTRTNNRVSFDYQWLGGVAVDELVILFREPEGAVGIQTGANFVDIGLLSDNQRYYQWSAGSAAINDVRLASFSYEASGNMPASSLGREESFDVHPILFGVGGLIAGGLAGWFLANRQKRTVRKPVITKTREPASSKPAVYCHQCGASIKGGDLFCRQCGEKVA